MQWSNPEWVNATVRYFLTALGVLFTQVDLVSETQWDNITAAVVAVLTAVYGILRTKAVEADLDAAKENEAAAVAALSTTSTTG